jgi:DNA polymerase-3 subunit alpha
MPDFDIDFCQEPRPRDRLRQAKYGRDAVSPDRTFGTMAAKAVVRDVGRVLGMPYGQVDRLAKLVPFEPGKMTLEKALAESDELRARSAYEDDEESARGDRAAGAGKLEGLTRNVGMHAGGVLIAPGRLTDFCPLYCEPGATARSPSSTRTTSRRSAW